jgi:uncharacterized protein (DUF1501 family)
MVNIGRPTRRGFIRGCSAAIAGMTGARFAGLAFADPGSGYNQETLVVIFLRGGLDGLNLVMPLSGADRGYYETARPDLAVPTSGADAAVALDSGFGLHPAAAQWLHPLYQENKLSVVLAAGLDEANRSHFDAQEYMDRGTPGDRTTATGWLARHMASAHNLPDEIVMPSLSVGSTQATSLLGDHDAINLTDPDSFNLEIGPWRWRDAQRRALRTFYSSDSTWLHTSGLQALDAMDLIELNASGSYAPANGADYPSNSFGDAMQVVAQMVKLDLGLRVAAVDLGGWDTHNGQGDGSGGFFADLLGTLAQGMAALYTDLDGAGSEDYAQRLSMVVQSEFGRRLKQNADRGTDHGHGNVMLVLSGSATGGIHGDWPGLAPAQLFDSADVAVTTDFRRVLSEILIRRMGNNHLGFVFPGYTGYTPLGVVSGTDLTPDYSATGDGLFADDFESGGISMWSNVSG